MEPVLAAPRLALGLGGASRVQISSTWASRNPVRRISRIRRSVISSLRVRQLPAQRFDLPGEAVLVVVEAEEPATPEWTTSQVQSERRKPQHTRGHTCTKARARSRRSLRAGGILRTKL